MTKPTRFSAVSFPDLFLPSSGLMIGGIRLCSKRDPNGNIDFYLAGEGGREVNLTGEALLARATSSLTLTTSYASITGDGNSSKVRLLLPTIGEWTVDATALLEQNGADDPGVLQAALFVNDSGTEESGDAVFRPQAATHRATVSQRWKITTTAVNTPVELKAKQAEAGDGLCTGEHTNLSAIIGAGGGSTVETVDHGTLTGRGDDDHAQYGQLADAETVPGLWDFTGGLKADTISESTPAAGVSVDGVLLKDGKLQSAISLADGILATFGTGGDATFLYDGTDLIINPRVVGGGNLHLVGGGLILPTDNASLTLGAGEDAAIYYDGTHLQLLPQLVGDGNVNILLGNLTLGEANATVDGKDVSTLGTSAEAVTAVKAEDPLALAGEVTLADGKSLNLQEAITFTGATGENLIEIPDNLADALSVNQGVNTYLRFVTTDGFETVAVLKNFAVLGNITVTGTVDGVDVAARDHAQAHAGDHVDGTDDIQTATTGQKGIVSELATVAEANTGTDEGKACTPNSLGSPKRTILLTAAGGAPTTTNGCSEPTKNEAGTNDVDYWSLDFVNTDDEFAFWGPFDMPDNWDGGTLTAVFKWTTASGGAGKDVEWGIQLASRDDDEAIDDSWGAAVTVNDDWLADGDVHKTAETAAITPDTADVRAGGDLMFVRVFRDVSEEDDSVYGDAQLLSVRLIYTTEGYEDA